MFAVKLSIQCLVYYTVFVVVMAAEKEEDYSIKRVLHLAKGCDNESLKQKCQQECGENHGCLLGKCFCLQQAEPRIYAKNLLNQKTPTKEDTFLDFDDYTEMTPTSRHKPDESFHKPVLRHHIAHFCPNLEEARKCIRGCMKVGKPAFCGRDHVCYCGHSYNTPGDDTKVDASNIYSQYQDLYKKYFGSQFSFEDHH